MVIAADLTPGDVMSYNPETVKAVVTAAGAPLSHPAILARSRAIPTVSGLGPAVHDLQEGTVVLVDGDSGEVHVAPPDEMVQEAHARQRAADAEQEEARGRAAEPAVTRDGHTIAVLANVGNPDDTQKATSAGADGVGMLRTEFAFLNGTEPPTEEEQYAAYRRVAEAVGEGDLIIRTLDLGADIPAWDAPPEPNPALGNRGLRFCLSAPDLLETQLRAIIRLAQERPVRVMFPMVTTVEELRQARACLDKVSGAATVTAPEVGITVEVPAAALTAEAFASHVDFFAIGTNDLTQYTLATDRSNSAVAGLADGLHPGVLRLIRQVTAAGARHQRSVEVVGELACDRLGIPVLLGLGVGALSVRPNAVASVKQIVRSVTFEDVRHLAHAALRAESAGAVRELASKRLSGRR